MSTAQNVSRIDFPPLVYSWVKQRNHRPLTIARGDGIYLWDADGRKFADFASAQISVNVGYNHPKVQEAIRSQLEKIAYAAPPHQTDVELKLAAAVVEVSPCGLNHVFFTNSGAEGIETAIKIARAVTGRYKIYSAWQSYHGATHGASSVTGDPRRMYSEGGCASQPKFHFPNCYRNPFSSHDPEVVAAMCLASLTSQIEYDGPETVAAILIESIVGTSGLYVPPASFVTGLRAICDRFGILLIFDETMCGWGRTGRWFACEHFSVTPDIMVTAKGITSGYVPFGCVVMTTAIYEYFCDRPFIAGSTTEGHALGCAAGLANVEIYKTEDLISRSAKLGTTLVDGLQELKKRHPSVGDIRGCGLFACIELTRDRALKAPIAGYRNQLTDISGQINSKLLSLGISTLTKWDWIFVAPPLIINLEQIDDALNKFDDLLTMTDSIIC